MLKNFFFKTKLFNKNLSKNVKRPSFPALSALNVMHIMSN